MLRHLPTFPVIQWCRGQHLTRLFKDLPGHSLATCPPLGAYKAHGTPYGGLSMLALVPSHDFPELKHLELEIKPYPPVNGWLDSGLLNAPKLSYLRIPFLPTVMSESSLDVSWQNITHLSTYDR